MSAQRQYDHRGTAMTAGGATVAGLGVLGGGIPGAREPKGLEVFNLRGSRKKVRQQVRRGAVPSHADWGRDARGDLSPLHPKNLGHNAKLAAPLPRAGLLGFRASVHQGMLDTARDEGHMPHEPKPRTAYDKGRLKGAVEAERKVVRGMRIARRGTYGLTAGGLGLVAAGHRRKQQSGVLKRETQRERGLGAGVGGATAGGLTGAYAGVRLGPEAGIRVVNRNIKREWERDHPKLKPGQIAVGGNRFMRRKVAVGRGLATGVGVGTAALGTAGYRLARGEKVTASKGDRFERNSAAAAGAGAGLAATGTVVPAGLKHFSRGYNRSARRHVLAAQKLVPGLGGLETLPEKRDPHFGNVTKPAKPTMYPAVRGAKVGEAIARSKAPAHVKHAAGQHRSIATQERHFVEVMDSTARGFKRVRGPGLALTAAGLTGLAGAKGKRDFDEARKTPVRKSREYGYMDRKRSAFRTAELGVGVGLGAWGASRLHVGPLVNRGVKMATERGYEREARVVAGHGRRIRNQVRSGTGKGEVFLRDRIPGFGTSLDKVPAKMQPAAATATGALLAARAVPTHDERFTPTGRF